MQNVSGFGLRVVIKASVTFPSGFTVTQFADDADPVDSPATAISDTAMGLNGELVVWNTANPLPLTLNVVPGGDDDRNLEVLATSNMVGRGRTPARDVITATILYPDGRSVTLSQGVITEGMVTRSVAASSRIKTRPYSFAFESITRN